MGATMQGSSRKYKKKTKKQKKERDLRAKRKGEAYIPEYIKRRAQRRSELGLQNEDRVLDILEQAVDKGRFSSFRKTRRSGPEDFSGKDFIVKKIVHGEVVEISFGVTISLKSQQTALLRHGLPCFLITPEMKDETFLRKVDKLFEE